MNGRILREVVMLGLVFNDVRVVFFFERVFYYGNGIFRVGFKGMVKIVFCNVIKVLIG